MLISILILAQAQAAAVPQPVQQPPAEKPICRMQEPQGSRIPVRVCHTKAEWDQIARESQDSFTTVMGKQGLENPPPGR